MAYDKVVDSAVLDAGLKQIADAIREKAGTTDALAFPQEIADAIAAIQSGGATIEPLTISENGTYTAPDGVDGYSPVTVEVKGSGEELVITDCDYFYYKGARSSLLGKLDTSNCELFRYMFYNNNYVDAQHISKLNLSKGREFSYMFSSCNKLTYVPSLDTSKGIYLQSMFESAIRLETIDGLDLNRANSSTSVSRMFAFCSNLTNLYLYNIRKTIQIGSGTSWGHLLTVDSLVHTIKELCTVTSSQTLTIGSANLEKIAGLYCRITDDTNEKKTMELCESTDEGAMTLTEYATVKGWQIK